MVKSFMGGSYVSAVTSWASEVYIAFALERRLMQLAMVIVPRASSTGSERKGINHLRKKGDKPHVIASGAPLTPSTYIR
jgi:hypothetical protein